MAFTLTGRDLPIEPSNNHTAQNLRFLSDLRRPIKTRYLYVPEPIS